MSDPAAPEPVHAVPLGANRYVIVHGDQRRAAFAVQVGRAIWVFLDGRVSVVEPDRADDLPDRRGDDDAALAAPMPATVVAVEVEPGQRVSVGDVLVRLEAMKMELSIKAPRDGIVESVACHAGQFVQPGGPLVRLG